MPIAPLLANRTALIIAVAAAGLVAAWMLLPLADNMSRTRFAGEAPSTLTPAQVNREAHATQLAPRPGAPGSVPMAMRRAASDTCEGYNIELVEVAAVETRMGRPGNAQRLLDMRQDCTANISEHFRSTLR